jgi:Zn-dependent protease
MENNNIVGSIPWPVAVATAAWFGVMAYKAGKSSVLWAIGGGLLGLIATTIVLGLGQATFIPFYTEEITPFRMKLAGLAIVLVVCVGWLFTGILHRHLLASLKPRSAAPPPPAVPAKPPATSLKQ